MDYTQLTDCFGTACGDCDECDRQSELQEKRAHRKVQKNRKSNDGARPKANDPGSEALVREGSSPL